MTCLGLLPPFKEQRNFRLSTNQGCQSSDHSHVETPPGSAFPEDAVYVEGLSNPSERLCSQVLRLEIASDQAIGRFTDQEGIGRSQSLDSGGDIWGLS